VDFSEYFRAKPYLVAVLAASIAQTVKVVSFLILEKRVNFKRFVETDGSPNMHSSAFAAMSLYIGLANGFGSLVFTLALCITVMASVDIWNVKRAHVQHEEFLTLLLDRFSNENRRFEISRKALSYTPLDVLSGTLLGFVVALMVI